METLHRSRTGDCTKEDLHEIRKLVLTNPECHMPDFDKAPWDDAILVTPRNSMRTMWNSAALTKHCQKTGQILYVCDAEDTVGKDHLQPDMEQKTTIAKIPLDSLKGLDHRIELAIRMKAMVMTNIATQADLANGSRGIIADIVLDAREDVDREQAERDGVVKLQYPPALVVFEPYHHTFPKFHSLKEGQIPIFPQDLGFTISTTGKPRTKIHRRQYPLTPAYAFTDHKAQGQTLEYVIVDIGPVPEKFGISPLGVYVALSRGRGREQIRLLRDFDDNLFMKHPSEDLRVEDERLTMLTEMTKDRWDTGFYD
jgi:ATP-dependent exoDNAse (exonuclease V) alpha subunit